MSIGTHARQRPQSVRGKKAPTSEKAPRRKQATPDTEHTRRPRGREEVMAAVLDAATTLFATRGPASVSVRDIASAAGVNHALVHRHFSSKQEVLRAVLERTVQEIAAVAAEISDVQADIGRLFATSAAHETHWRALARALLDGEDPRTLQRDFPTIHRLITLLESEDQSRSRRRHQSHTSLPHDVRVVVGALCALMLGWLVFEPFLLVATGLEQEDQEAVREQIVRILQGMMANT